MEPEPDLFTPDCSLSNCKENLIPIRLDTARILEIFQKFLFYFRSTKIGTIGNISRAG